MRNETIKVNNQNVALIEWNGERVITTAQLANVYETDINNIQANFSRNFVRFEQGIHYYLLKGKKLKEFKDHLTDSQIVAKNTAQLYLWTKRGASRHCKILDTEKAWEQFDYLEEAYFNPKPIPDIPYQYPLSAATFESVANLGRLVERVMKAEGACPHEIAMTLQPIFEQAGIKVQDCFVKIPAYEQLTISGYNEIITR